jgi:hypothetical protein
MNAVLTLLAERFEPRDRHIAIGNAGESCLQRPILPPLSSLT